MPIEHPTQLAQLLSRIAALYPYGIPTSAIVAPAEQAAAVESVRRVRARLVVVGDEASTSVDEIALLDAIATKGLKLTSDGYSKEFVQSASVAFAPGSVEGGVTILFGCSGAPEGAVGHVITTGSLSELMGDASLKKTLWRELQGVGS